MKIQELRQLTPKKLLEKLKKIQREYAVEKFHVKTGKSQNVAQLKKTRRAIARIKTLFNSEKK